MASGRKLCVYFVQMFRLSFYMIVKKSIYICRILWAHMGRCRQLFETSHSTYYFKGEKWTSHDGGNYILKWKSTPTFCIFHSVAQLCTNNEWQRITIPWLAGKIHKKTQNLEMKTRLCFSPSWTIMKLIIKKEKA